MQQYVVDWCDVPHTQSFHFHFFSLPTPSEDANTNTRQANECSARPSSSYPCHNILDKNSLRQKEGEMKSWELQADETNQFSHFAVCGKCLFFTLHSSSCRLFCIPANTQKEEKNFSTFPRLEFLNVILPKCRHVSVMSTRLCCLLIKRRLSFPLSCVYTIFYCHIAHGGLKWIPLVTTLKNSWVVFSLSSAANPSQLSKVNFEWNDFFRGCWKMLASVC